MKRKIPAVASKLWKSITITYCNTCVFPLSCTTASVRCSTTTNGVRSCTLVPTKVSTHPLSSRISFMVLQTSTFVPPRNMTTVIAILMANNWLFHLSEPVPGMKPAPLSIRPYRSMEWSRSWCSSRKPLPFYVIAEPSVSRKDTVTIVKTTYAVFAYHYVSARTTATIVDLKATAAFSSDVV